LSFNLYKKSKLNFISSEEMVDTELSLNGLKRGSATTLGNNCLLDSYYQLITSFSSIHFPEKTLGNLEEFVEYIRNRLQKNDNEMLIINDEVEGVQVLSAIQQYLKDKVDLICGFELKILIAMSDGIAMVDNVDELQNQFNHSNLIIPIKIIQVGYNHYEPIFNSLDPTYTNLGLKEKLSNLQAQFQTEAKIQLPSVVVQGLNPKGIIPPSIGVRTPGEYGHRAQSSTVNEKQEKPNSSTSTSPVVNFNV
jgi:hypothetical protein